jgi:CO dehydrogenase/acetyl-CoA synthase beta subunit
MYIDEIEISGNRVEDDQQWRIRRIHALIGYAQALADLDENEDFYKKIKSIYDDKGILFVNWLSEPDNNEKEYIEKAWNSIVTDYESNDVIHEFP